MTVSYQYDVASSTSGGFTRLLFKWKGSVYKLVWRELLWFTFAFTVLSVLYRAFLTEEQKRVFERVVYYFDAFLGLIPLSFVLGVYVTLVVTRWWQQFLAIPWPDNLFAKLVVACDNALNFIPLTFITGFYVTFVAARWWQQYVAIPWPDRIAHCLSLYVSGNDERSRIIRRTLTRYLNLSLILVLRSISMAVKKRFPTLQHLVEGGFMTKTELDIYQSVPSSEFNTYWIPCTWFINLIKEARKGDMITDSQGLKLLIEEFNEFRSKCGLLWSYDWVSIPLVYTQVVTLATYSFFAACVIGRQYVALPDPEANKNRVDLYVPISTILQFFFYMGLLKVAEALINPFGDDDEDFELNWMIDRHLKVCYLVVDTLLNRNPPLVKDQHYDDPEPTLAYTKASMMYKKKTFRGSVAAVLVPEDEQTMFLPEIVEEDEQNSEYTSDLSINKHSNSIMNLISWTTTAGGRMLHPKRSLGEEFKAHRSLSVTEDAMNLEIESLSSKPTRDATTDYKNDTTSGIRGLFSSSLARSSESLHLAKVISYSDSSKVVQRGESFSGQGIGTELSDTGQLDSAAARKSRSLDITTAENFDSEQLRKFEDFGAMKERNRSRSCVPRLRDLKRKRKRHQLQQQKIDDLAEQQQKAGRRPWRSKESIHIDEGAVKLDDAMVSVPLEDVSKCGVGTTLSYSLPSLHLRVPTDSTTLEIEDTKVDNDETDTEEYTSPNHSPESKRMIEITQPIQQFGPDNGVSTVVHHPFRRHYHQPVKKDLPPSTPTRHSPVTGKTPEHLV